MIKYLYEADWHKTFKNKYGQLDGDTIDSTGIQGWSKSRVIAQAKKALLKLYANKEQWKKELERNNAVDIDIIINCYEVDTDRGIWDGGYFTLETAWNEFDPQWTDMEGSVVIRNGKAQFKDYRYSYPED